VSPTEKPYSPKVATGVARALVELALRPSDLGGPDKHTTDRTDFLPRHHGA
jgi:hypothetical protein